MKPIKEIRIDYIDDDNLQHVDCWFTEDDNENGKTVAVVDLDTKKVIFIDNAYRLDSGVKVAIDEILNSISSCIKPSINIYYMKESGLLAINQKDQTIELCIEDIRDINTAIKDLNIANRVDFI